MPGLETIRRLLPGIALSIAVTALATLLQLVEVHFTGQPYLEALVIAILLGVAIRTLWEPTEVWKPGIEFSAKMLLEVAVMLLGAAISLHEVVTLGLPLLFGIMVVVLLAIASSYGICRALGLGQRMAILVACGNSICGNSAIAAVAPIIDADGDDIASSIAFTAVLGVIVVLALPFLVPLLALSLTQYGVLAGLTVYAVPQVLAATLPIGALSNQIGTVIKLVRVLMLGPVVLGMSLIAGRLAPDPGKCAPPPAAVTATKPVRLPLHQLVPWFIVGFLLVATMRNLGVLPKATLVPIATVASVLTTVSMAALGLGVDVRVVAQAGVRVTTAVTLSLIVLGIISFGLLRLVGVR